MATAATPARSNGPAGFLEVLEGSRDQLAKVLPEHVKADRVVRVARTAWMMDAKLQECSPKSILSAVMRACEMGLEPSGALKHCYLVPYGRECQLILGYAGLLELARRSGQYLKIETRVVHERDQFLLEYNPDPVFKHVPHLEGDAGPEKLVYAYARLKGGELAFEVMTRAQVEAVRHKLRQPNTPSWRDYWGEMGRKVVLKRLLKRMPLSVEIADAIDRDNAYETTIEATARVAAPPAASKADAIADRLAGRAALPGPDEDCRETPHDLADAESSDLDAPEGREPGSDDE
jgi:recombination protein RecT